MADLRRNSSADDRRSASSRTRCSGKIAVTEDEARKYYDAHSTSSRRRRRSRCARFSSRCRPIRAGVNVAADEAAKAKAEAIRARAVGGERFEKLAADVSDAPSKANAGLIGPLNLNDLSADLRKIDRRPEGRRRHDRAAHAARLSDPASSNRRRRRQTLPFEQAREQISERVVHRQAARRVPEVPREAARAGDHRVEERGREEGLRRRARAAAGQGRAPAAAPAAPDRPWNCCAVVRHLDPLAPRAGRPRAARAQAHRRVPADHHPLEPLEGPQEEDRLAAVPRLLLRAVRSRSTRCRS